MKFSMTMSRRHFLAGSASAFFLPGLHPGGQMAQTPQAPVPPKPDPLPAALVREFVIKGHGDLAATKELLEEHPQLLNACWDWGGGDFETALEGAGHVGSRDCAQYLLSKGARLNIFAATMLGRLDIVKATLTAFPDLIRSRGPHGLTFLHHARKGGADAEPVLAYLVSLGAE